MAILKITTPVPDYTGTCGAVTFEQGVGYADEDAHAAEIAYMRANGYTVEGDDSEQAPTPAAATEPATEPAAESIAGPPAAAPPADDKMPARNGSADAWRAYAIAHGMDPDEAAELSRDQLVERFASKEETPK